MIIEIKIPTPGESVTEVTIANWLVNDGDFVNKNQEIAEIESEKATLSLIADDSGKIKIIHKTGETVKVGTIACTIDTSQVNSDIEKTENNKTDVQTIEIIPEKSEHQSISSNVKITPVAKKMMEEYQLSVDDIISGLKKISSKEVKRVVENKESNEVQKNEPINEKSQLFSREKEEIKISPLRKKLSERLVAVKNETAMLTSFNEVDMSAVNEMRSKYNSLFQEKYGVKIGFISIFAKAASIALKLFPEINAMIDGENIVYHRFSDIGVAVQSPKGLLVPVIRNTESLSIADIELKIKEFAIKAQANKISLDDLNGGTFTITNGGTFGSLFSTPIINPPQSGILGMHNIVERPVAIKGKVEIRPMMYIALSYDHRLIDGKSAVLFLVKIKELIENPINQYFEGNDGMKMMLGL